MPAFLWFWGEVLKAFLKIAQTAFQKHSWEDGWSAWWKRSRTEVVVSVISVMDADQLMFIYLQQFNVTFENNQNDGFCQLVTSENGCYCWSGSKWLRMGCYPVPPPPPHPHPHSHFRVSDPYLRGCEMISQSGCFSSPHSGSLHCPLQCSLYGQGSCPVAILKMGTWKGPI